MKQHPITGRWSPRCNYHGVSDSWILDTIDENGQRMGTGIVEELMEAMSEIPNCVYEHRWVPNDIVLYDNWPFVHRRDELDLLEGQERLMWRANVDHDISLKERVYVNQEQKLSICGLRVGKNKENNHYRDERDFDVFDVKKDLYVALESLNIKTSNLEITNENLRYFHPHRNSSLKFGKNIIANFGELHPAINQYFSIKQRLNYFEIFVDDQFISKKLNGFKAFLANDFPIVERDFAVIVDDDLAVAKLQKAIIDIDKNLIKEVNIFDVFINPAIGENKKSVALNVKIQDNKTLTSTEIDEISKKIITTLGAKFNADLRY
jgi:phenylalanyl-tRNA synthetase beta subunit